MFFHQLYLHHWKLKSAVIHVVYWLIDPSFGFLIREFFLIHFIEIFIIGDFQLIVILFFDFYNGMRSTWNCGIHCYWLDYFNWWFWRYFSNYDFVAFLEKRP